MTSETRATFARGLKLSAHHFLRDQGYDPTRISGVLIYPTRIEVIQHVWSALTDTFVHSRNVCDGPEKSRHSIRDLPYRDAMGHNVDMSEIYERYLDVVDEPVSVTHVLPCLNYGPFT